MTDIISLNQIKTALKGLDLSASIAQGFVAYSQGRVVVPPVGELMFDHPPGDTHIKYGYIQGAPHYVIKIAAGFYENPTIGLPSNSGLMLVFSSRTGQIETILLDEGYLTDVRTAVAGQIAAQYLAPTRIHAIGVLGTGVQARMQVEYLKPVTQCSRVIVWGRNRERALEYKKEMGNMGYRVSLAQSPAQVAAQSNLLLTTTPSKKPLLTPQDIQPGTHITAMGSDTPDKQELDPGIFKAAEIVVADSLPQCRDRGEISKALATEYLKEKDVIELGRVIETAPQTPARSSVRSSNRQISIADLTGVAVQDIQIATAVCQALKLPSDKNTKNHRGNYQ